MVNEEERTTDQKIELDETALEGPNQNLNLVKDVIRDGIHSALSIMYFVPDPLKAGGRYDTVTEEIRRIDAVRGKIVLMRTEGKAGLNVEMDINHILEIRGELVDDPDDTIDSFSLHGAVVQRPSTPANPLCRYPDT